MKVGLRRPERDTQRFGHLAVREPPVGAEEERGPPLRSKRGERVRRERYLGVRLHLLEPPGGDDDVVDGGLEARAAALSPAVHHPSARDGEDERSLARSAVEAVGVPPELDEDVLERILDVVTPEPPG